MFQWLVVGLALALALWFLGARALRGADLQAFDSDRHGGAGSRRTRFSSGLALNDEHRAVIASLGGIAATLKGAPRAQHLGLLRNYMDNMTSNRVLDAKFNSVDADGVRAEWVLAPDADPTRRTR